MTVWITFAMAWSKMCLYEGEWSLGAILSPQIGRKVSANPFCEPRQFWKTACLMGSLLLVTTYSKLLNRIVPRQKKTQSHSYIARQRANTSRQIQDYEIIPHPSYSSAPKELPYLWSTKGSSWEWMTETPDQDTQPRRVALFLNNM